MRKNSSRLNTLARAAFGRARLQLHTRALRRSVLVTSLPTLPDVQTLFSSPVVLRGVAAPDPRSSEPLLGRERSAWIRARAAEIHDGRFDLLGSGLLSWGDGPANLDWHGDPVSGARWAMSGRIAVRARGADIKRPWELARFHFAVRLAQAEWLENHTGHRNRFMEAVGSFCSANPYPHGIHWACAMEVAIRALNILLALELFHWKAPLPADFLQHVACWLWRHGEFLVRQREYVGEGLNYNHLLANLVGQLILGIRFAGLDRADFWIEDAMRELDKALPGQLTPDGLIYESSSHYHLFCTELLLLARLVSRRNGYAMTPELDRRIEDMVRATLALAGPDGRLPGLGDGDSGRVFELGPGRDYDPARSLGALLPELSSPDRFWLAGAAVAPPHATTARRTTSTLLRASRIAILGADDMWLCVSALGPGTGGLGLHAHNDDLSCELAWGDERYIIDPGTFSYTGDPGERRRLRSALAHSAPTLDDHETHGFIPRRPFLVWNRGDARVDHWHDDGTRALVELSHDAYRRLGGRPRLSRGVYFDPRERGWLFCDRRFDTRARLFTRPPRLATTLIVGSRGVSVRGSTICIESTRFPGKGLRILSLSPETVVHEEEFFYSPRYGVLARGTRLRLTLPRDDGTHLWMATACDSLAQESDPTWALEAARALGWTNSVGPDEGELGLTMPRE